METLLSDSIVWLWGLDWSVNNDDISRYFQQEFKNKQQFFSYIFLSISCFFNVFNGFLVIWRWLLFFNLSLEQCTMLCTSLTLWAVKSADMVSWILLTSHLPRNVSRHPKKVKIGLRWRDSAAILVNFCHRKPNAILCT